ncbi:hypothetical protein FRC20_001600 [Serendipita sp. 405]|nr:hypothetical protein FRC20_001600 [Serendipita sp. 405]
MTTTLMTTTAQYSPLPLLVHSDDREHERLSSPLVSPSREDPAPPYSPCAASAGPSSRPLVDMSDSNTTAEKSGLRRVPTSTPLIPYQKRTLDSSTECAVVNRSPVHHRPPPISTFKSPESPNYVLHTDSPCATPPPQYSSRSTSPNPSTSSRSSIGVDASSFNSGPVPQYSITIYSSPRSFVHAYDVQGQPVGIHVPDIVLSPVPWLPSSNAYPTSSADRTRRSNLPPSASMAGGGGRRPVSPALGSPPGYLEVPSRKSRSRRHAEREKEKAKGLMITRSAPPVPAVSRQRDLPSENDYRRDHASWSQELKKRRAFATTTTTNESANPPPVPPKSPARATSGSSSSMQRCHSLPLTRPSNESEGLSARGSLLTRSRSTPSMPPPRPVLPMDLEAVYPSEHQQHHYLSQASGGGKGAGVVSSAISYGDEKKQRGREVDERSGRESEEEEDAPLSKTLLLAMRKKTDELKSLKGDILPSIGLGSDNNSNSSGGNGEERRLSSSLVTNMVKMQIFGRLGALAARAKMAIEKELDSDEEEEQDEEEQEGDGGNAGSRWEVAERRETEMMAHVKHAQFLSRENAFVIGEEEE